MPAAVVNSFSPSCGVAAVGAVAFVLTAIAATWRILQYRAWVLIFLLLGIYLEAATLVSRVYWATHLASVHAFLYAYAGAIIAPSFLAAGCYMVFGRIVWLTLPADRCSARYLWVPPRLITPLFVLIDLLSFVIQFFGLCAIGSATTSKDPKAQDNAKVGDHALRLGLILQLIGFVLFAVIAVRLGFVIRQPRPAPGSDEVRSRDLSLRRLRRALVSAAAVISLRAVYRVFEFSGIKAPNSPAAYIKTHEWPYWIFDAVPSLVVCILLTIFHAGTALPSELTRFRCSQSTLARVREATETAQQLRMFKLDLPEQRWDEYGREGHSAPATWTRPARLPVRPAKTLDGAHRETQFYCIGK